MRIAHLADIHVQDRRREEYAAVLEHLLAGLERNPVDAIAIAGDVFHMMTRASANNWTDVARLFERLSAVAPLHVIPGNHDLNVRAADSPDLISPMLSAAGGAKGLQPPHVTYWRHGGVFSSAGAVWVVGVPDGTFPAADELGRELARHPRGTPVVGLFHETVDGAKFANGIAAPEGGRLSRSYLAALAAAALGAGSPCAILLGDVHLRQEIRFAGSGAAAAAWYPGSLVCQSFGESHLGHGWLRWTLAADGGVPAVAVEHFDVPNPQSYLTIDIAGGADVTPAPLPSAPRAVRLRYDAATDPERLAAAVKAVEARYGMTLRSVEPVSDYNTGGDAAAPRAQSQDGLAAATAAANDWTRHEKYIREALAESPERLVEAVVARHRDEVARELGQTARGGRLELVRLEFDNIYCYGPGNVIDFEALRDGPPGLRGLVAPNRAGKSAMFDILTFALTDTVPRGIKKDLVRRGAKSYSVRMTFRLDGVEGRVEKTGMSWKFANPTLRLWLGDEELTESTTPQTAAALRALAGEAVHLESIAMARPSDVTGRKPFALLAADARREVLASMLRLGVFALVEKKVGAEISTDRAELRGITASVGEVTDVTLGELAEGAAAAARRVERAREDAQAEEARHTEAARAEAAARRESDRKADEVAALGLTPAELTAAGDPAAEESPIEELEIQAVKLRERLAKIPAADPRLAARYTEEKSKYDRLDGAWRSLGCPEARALTEEERQAAAAIAASQARIGLLEGTLSGLRPLTPEETALAAEEEPTAPTSLEFETLVREAPAAGVLERLGREAENVATPGDIEALTAAEGAAGERARRAADQVDRLHRALQTIGAPDAAAQGSAAEPFNSVAELGETLRAYTEAKRSAEVHKDLRLKVQPRLELDACEGCRHTAQLLGAGDYALALGLLTRLQIGGRGLLARLEREASAAAAEQAEAGRTLRQARYADAQQRVAKLSAARDGAARRERWQAARRLADADSTRVAAEQRLATERRALEDAEAALRRANAVKIAAARDAAAQAYGEAAENLDRLQEREGIERELGVAETALRGGKARGIVRASALARREAAQARAAYDQAEARRRAAAAALTDATLAARDAEARLDVAARARKARRPVEERLETRLAYRRILSPKTGLASALLDEARATVEQRINATLATMETTFRVTLAPDYEMTLIDNTTEVEIPPALGSGYQQFALDLASRAALAQIAQVPIPACMFIDEGFGCLDEVNLARVAEALSAYAALDPRILVLAVTHREDLNAHFARQLTIEPGDETKGSRVVYPPGASPTEPRGGEAAAAAKAATRAAAAGGGAAGRGAGGDTYSCHVCGVTLKATWAAKHEASAKHAAAVKREEETAAIVDGDSDARLANGKIECIRCGSSFTPAGWARHIETSKHKKR